MRSFIYFIHPGTKNKTVRGTREVRRKMKLAG